MRNVVRLAVGSSAARFELRISDLRQWTYCPRVLWWTYVCPVPKWESFKMRQGLKKEHRLQQLQKRRTLRAFSMAQGTATANVPLSSPTLGLHGRLDLLLESGQRRYPVEIKYTHGPVQLNHCLQLAGYALLLEERFRVPVPHGYVVRLPENAVSRVEIDEPLRAQVRRTMEQIRATLAGEHMPPPTSAVNRCLDCEYRNHCGDVPRPALHPIQFPE